MQEVIRRGALQAAAMMRTAGWDGIAFFPATALKRIIAEVDFGAAQCAEQIKCGIRRARRGRLPGKQRSGLGRAGSAGALRNRIAPGLLAFRCIVGPAESARTQRIQ
jgi:hypothetical protein